MYIVLKFNVIHFFDIRDSGYYVKTTFTVSPSKTGDARIKVGLRLKLKTNKTHGFNSCIVISVYQFHITEYHDD